ncbi:MAG: hypothetical protein FJZ47_14020 [Candidatus Tectomicrobia bacterium]|uniref:histidine kinase n=1 Tax=Tectimicrobiota bacterium TaxID=2528274 RepID=A0A937W2B4_UNCTE|nr:hypothetical protein [Candidatus Tectomicrobia bacterium]
MQTGPRDGETVALQTEALPEADLELLSDFVDECREHLQHIEIGLLALETDPEDHEALQTVFRAFHTVKGTAAFLRLERIATLAHHTESLLSHIRDGHVRCSGAYADLALRAADMLKGCTQAVQQALETGRLVTPAGFDTLLQQLQRPATNGAASTGEPLPVSPPRLGDILVAEGKVDREDIEMVVAARSGLPLGLALLRAGTATLPDVARALRLQRRFMGGEGGAEPSIRVRAGHLDHLLDLLSELETTQAALVQDEALWVGASPALYQKVTQLSRLIRGLHQFSMTLRMVPLKPTFQKMLRVVRDVAQQRGKLVEFQMVGENTDIDRNVADMLADPLIHLVRNAVDHGLEPPDVRERLGKPRTGIVQLHAYHQSGQVVIELHDDGQGLDRHKIVQQAIARGRIHATQTLTDPEIWALIFEAGFSTATQITEISGRGVGLDIVKKKHRGTPRPRRHYLTARTREYLSYYRPFAR